FDVLYITTKYLHYCFLFNIYLQLYNHTKKKQSNKVALVGCLFKLHKNANRNLLRREISFSFFIRIITIIFTRNLNIAQCFRHSNLRSKKSSQCYLFQHMEEMIRKWFCTFS